MSCVLLDDRLKRALEHGPEELWREVENIKADTWRDLADYEFLAKDRQDLVHHTFSCVLLGCLDHHARTLLYRNELPELYAEMNRARQDESRLNAARDILRTFYSLAEVTPLEMFRTYIAMAEGRDFAARVDEFLPLLEPFVTWPSGGKSPGRPMISKSWTLFGKLLLWEPPKRLVRDLAAGGGRGSKTKAWIDVQRALSNLQQIWDWYGDPSLLQTRWILFREVLWPEAIDDCWVTVWPSIKRRRPAGKLRRVS